MHNKSHAGENIENFPLEIGNDTGYIYWYSVGGLS